MRGARVDRIGREADLVVHDQVQRAADAIAAQPRQVERLGDDALARERRVAVDADRQHEPLVARARRPRDALLARAPSPDITGFTTSRWLGFGASSNLTVAAADRALALVAEVVLHVARARSRRSLARARPSNSPNISTYGIAHDVREHVEAAAVRHADHDLARAPRARHASIASSIIGTSDVGSLDREPLAAEVGAAEEALEAIDLGQPAEHGALLVRRQRLRETRPSSIVAAEPVALLLVAEVRELEPDRPQYTSRSVPDDVGRRSRLDSPARSPARRRAPAR